MPRYVTLDVTKSDTLGRQRLAIITNILVFTTLLSKIRIVRIYKLPLEKVQTKPFML